MRISARKGSKITQNVFELKLTKPRKIILNLVTTVVRVMLWDSCTAAGDLNVLYGDACGIVG